MSRNRAFSGEARLLRRVRLCMGLDKARGRKTVALHLCSAGQAQFYLPVFEELRRRPWPLGLYLALDYPMPEVARAFGIPVHRCFPAVLARRMSGLNLFIESEIYGRGPAQAVKVFAGHGQPNKFTNWSEENLRAFDVYFLYGQLEREMFEVIRQAQPESTGHIRLMDIGYPKLDAQMRGDYDRGEVLRGLGLDPALKTVIYAPAWDPGCSLRTRGLEIVRALLSLPGVNVIVKLHPVSLEPQGSPYFEFYTGGTVWENEFAVFKDNPRFAFAGQRVVNPLLVASDALLTDFSGVALEFMLLDRPVLYMDCPEFYEKTQKEWGNDADMAKHDDRFNAGRNYGVSVSGVAELPGAVRHALAHPEELSGRRRGFISRFLYNPGRGALVFVDAVGELLGLDAAERGPAGKG
ncbi:MAG: CDP-glycerol glycerophosphotransferase family protein [Humidesulfovibrio sp.]